MVTVYGIAHAPAQHSQCRDSFFGHILMTEEMPKLDGTVMIVCAGTADTVREAIRKALNDAPAVKSASYVYGRTPVLCEAFGGATLT